MKYYEANDEVKESDQHWVSIFFETFQGELLFKSPRQNSALSQN